MPLLSPLALPHLGTALVMGTFGAYLALRPRKDVATRWLLGSVLAWAAVDVAYVCLGSAPPAWAPPLLIATWVGPLLAFWCTAGFVYTFLGRPFRYRAVLAASAAAGSAVALSVALFFLTGLGMPWVPPLTITATLGLLLLALAVSVRRATPGDGPRWPQLLVPPTREARAFRALAVAYGLLLVHGALVGLQAFGLVGGAVTAVSIVIAHVYLPLSLLVVYVNHVPDPTSFRVKVVGYALAVVVAAMALGALLVFPAELIRPARLSELQAVDPRVRALYDARATGYGALMAATFAAVLVTLPLFLRASVTRPLEGLLGALRRVDGGDLHARVPVRVHDEIGTLADGFNRMAASLRDHTEDLEGLVDARTAELARLSEDKSRLFANVSHELRTPLTLTIGPLEDLRDGLCGPLPPDARPSVDLALRNARRLLHLVDQILDVARLDAGAVRLSAAPADFRSAVRSAAEAMRPLAERLGVDLVATPDPSPVIVDLDGDQFEKVVANLLSNALKFTPRGGSVRVETSAAGGAARLTVSDTGPGIPPEDVERVFDRFYQVDESGNAPGTGIGLALAREIVDLHGGTIRAESAPGAGSRFVVSLPLSTAARATGHDEGMRTDDDAASGGSDGSPPGPNGALPAADHTTDTDGTDDATTVLVVDDHPDIRSYVRRHLGAPRDGRAPYRIVEGRDGAEGVSLARSLLPDLVVSDVMMPEVDGVELCRTLKSDPETDFIPVVLLTAKAGEEATLEGLGVGADDYVTKPFNVRELAARVDNFIDGRRKLRERIDRSPAPGPPLPPGLAPDEAAFFQSVHEAVAAGLSDEDFGVDAIAEAVGVSRSVLYRRFKPTGDTPSSLLRNARLTRAHGLLRERAGGVGEVAYAVGFKSVAHFSRSFRETYGLSPSAVAEAAAG